MSGSVRRHPTVQRRPRHFPTFTPILDFIHAVEHLYAAARAVSEDDNATWQLYVSWAEACWQGKMADVLAELRTHQGRLDSPPSGCNPIDPRQITAKTIGYFENNLGRMEYPQYRREELPITSAHMESFVKEMNYRVKSTEKFWNDGVRGESILQVRAASLSDDRNSRWYHNSSRTRGKPQLAGSSPGMTARHPISEQIPYLLS